jgi:nitrate reductase beta subunit
MVFHLDKCIGCHTCSVACKNIWTDRKGAEYQWWNNVETKPGTGYPSKWENQDIYKGGWEKKGNGNANGNDTGNGAGNGTGNGKGNAKGEVTEHVLQLKAGSKMKGLGNLFHNPNMPVIDDYYEPFTYKYLDLIESPASDDQPTARPVSLITGKPMDIKSGPNWDDDLSGSPDYARNDPNLKNLTEAEQEAMFQMEKMAFFYLPRICNHCLNPACVAACPSGALYKRGEDGIVLVNQEVCRGWRMCVSACPYKKVYYNWHTGKSEKCILCYPRLESGQAPACMHSCVGRIRYLGVILYDADKIEAVASSADEDLVQNHMDILLDPFDPDVIAAAKANGIQDSTIRSAQLSPTYKFVKEWGMALPLHSEFRTLPMLFYVPPLLPVMASLSKSDPEQLDKMGPVAKQWSDDWLYDTSTDELFGSLEDARFPLEYMASLFSGGDTEMMKLRLVKLMSIRIYRRYKTVGDISKERSDAALAEAGLTEAQADDIYYLTSLAKFDDRFVIPPSHREEAMEMMEFTGDKKGSVGFGFKEGTAQRGL